MEEVLDVYKRPYKAEKPLVCFDERPKQLIGQMRKPIPAKPGRAARYDYEYRRNGVANIFMMFEPLASRRYVQVTDRRTNVDFAQCMRCLVDDIYPDAKRIILVMDNLNTHKKASLYEAFEPAEARRIADKLEIHYTPKHGSWLNMAEIEISVMSRQCLSDRTDSIERLKKTVTAWQSKRSSLCAGVDWRFTTDNARVKLRKLYPIITGVTEH
jgi:transposase